MGYHNGYDHTDLIAAAIHAAAAKETPVDADNWALIDSEDDDSLKTVPGTNLKAYLKAYLDTLYQGRLAVFTAFDYVGLSSTAASAGGHAVLRRKQYEGSAVITADSSITLSLAHGGSGTQIPAEEKIVAVFLHVKTALATGELWDAALDDGATVLAIASGAAVEQNTDVALVDVTGVKTDAATDIKITKNGGGSFTAQGEIEAIVITDGWTSWAVES